MNKQLLKTINERFSHLAGRRVIIYGMGQMASELADNRDMLVFDIVAVMDRDVKDGLFCGLPVADTENVLDFANVIIIAALGSSCPIIYDRIAHLKERGIDIYFPDGKKRSARSETRASEYFIKTRTELLKLIDENDVISFDIFDTLIFRKCLYPKEVFNILESRRGLESFAERRAAAEKHVRAELGRHPTIYDIYAYLKSPADDEIALEIEMLTPRGDMLFFYNYALSKGKTVILTSDMYLPESVLREVLSGCGIGRFEKLYVSCDHNATKKDGALWDSLIAEYPGRKMLHVGDNQVSDSVERGGLSSFIIKSTVEIADLLGFGEALTSARGFGDYCAVGTALSRLLSLDLTRVDDDGRILLDSAEDIGYCFIAPQTVGFVDWLCKTASENSEEYLCFCARDTFMFMKLYEKLRQCDNAPTGKYLYISKRVLCGALCDTIENIRESLGYYYARFGAKTTIKAAVFRLFGVALPDDDFSERSAKEIDADGLADRIEAEYMELFIRNAESERANFYAHLSKQGIDPKSAAIVDYICGKSVRLARKFFGGNVYLYGRSDAGLADCADVFAWLEKAETPQLPYYHILKQSQLGEAVYSSPEGSCIAFNGGGEPVLDDETINFSVNDAVCRGVEKSSGDTPYYAGCEAADRIFGALFSGNFDCRRALTGLKWSSYTANKEGAQV